MYMNYDLIIKKLIYTSMMKKIINCKKITIINLILLISTRSKNKIKSN